MDMSAADDNATIIPAGGGVADVTAGDYILLSTWMTGNVKITLRYVPTNSLLGSWTINI